MLKKEEQEIVNLFRTNMKYYLGYDDIQIFITNITYLFWNAKYVKKMNMEIINNIDFLYHHMINSNDENKELSWEILNRIRGTIEESNLNNIFNYLDTLSEERLIEIICKDYLMYSRYNISTPNSINELAYRILEEGNYGYNVIDICSYTGNFLVNYAKKKPYYEYTGIDINNISNTIAKAKLNSLRVKNKVIDSNIFKYKFIEKFDKVFCNYPFGLRLSHDDLEMIKESKNVLGYDFSKKNILDWPFVDYVVNLLSKNGKAVIIMNNASLYRLTDLEYRKLLIENGYVEAVISLPEKIFSNTGMATNLLVLNKNNREDKKVKFINAENMIIGKTSYNSINELNIDEIMSEYRFLENSINSKLIDIKEIKKYNYSLYPQNYIENKIYLIKNSRKLNTVCKDIYRGYQLSANEKNTYLEDKHDRIEYKIVNITNIVDGEIEANLTKIYPDNNRMNKYLLRNNDLLVSSKGTLSKFAVVEIKENERIIPSGNFTVLRLDTTVINPYYLKIFFESNLGTSIINSIKSLGVLPAINLGEFKEISIPVPSLEEQKRLVDKYLAKKDEINMMKAKLKKLEDSLTEIINEEF